MHELSFSTWLIHISSVIEWIYAIFIINKSQKSKKIWDLNEFKGKWIVLYFYPKDFTAGCTLEAKGFSQLKNDFYKYNAEVIAVSYTHLTLPTKRIV